MKVSIVIPCYNDFKYVKQAVESAKNQNYDNKEIIVVDDGSEWRTKEVLQNIKPQIDKLITQKNKGQSFARNIGIKEASGEIILLWDSDDYFDSSFTSKAVAFLKDENIKIVSCYARCFNEKAEWLYRPIGGTLENFLFQNASLGCAMIRKKDWVLCGGFDENMTKGWEDWEFFIRLLKPGGTCVIIPEVLFHYRKRSFSTTSIANRNKETLWKYILKKHKDLYSFNYESLINYFLKEIEKHKQERLKVSNRLEYKIGYIVLKPLRILKRLING